MKKVIIPQKQSGSGSIHDLASQNSDRVIEFPKGSEYAVVLAAYYGGRGYTTHRTEEAAIAADKRNQDYSRQIIDTDGQCYDVEPDGNGYPMLVKRR